MRKPSPAMIVALLALFVALGGAGMAATGGIFILGKSNTADATSYFRPHVKISCLVTGVRHDRYAEAHPIRVVAPKAKKDQGKYLNPELYGKPRSAGIGSRTPPQHPSPKGSGAMK